MNICYDLSPHEKFLFGYMSSRPVPQELLFKESDYLRCKDFGQIYNELVNSAPTPYDDQEKTNDADADSLIESEKAKRRVLLTKIDGNAKIHTRYQSKANRPCGPSLARLSKRPL